VWDFGHTFTHAALLFHPATLLGASCHGAERRLGFAYPPAKRTEPVITSRYHDYQKYLTAIGLRDKSGDDT